MVKMEMVSIIRRGMGGFDDPGVPFGYQEMKVGGESTDSSSASVLRPDDATVGPGTKSAVTPASQTGAGGGDIVRPRRGGIILAASLGGMVVLVGALSAMVLLRAKKD
jgi:hypothetical protein